MYVTLNLPKKYRSVCTNDQLLGCVILSLQRLDVFGTILTKRILDVYKILVVYKILDVYKCSDRSKTGD